MALVAFRMRMRSVEPDRGEPMTKHTRPRMSGVMLGAGVAVCPLVIGGLYSGQQPSGHSPTG